MMNQQEENTVKAVLKEFTKAIEALQKELNEDRKKLDDVVSSQEKVKNSLNELATARKAGTPVQCMKAEDVQHTIKETLNSQLISSSIHVEVNDPVASIDKQSKEKIDGLITAIENIVEKLKNIKPKRALFNLTIKDGKKACWRGMVFCVFCLIAVIVAIVYSSILVNRANNKVNSIQNQAFYWGNRAYQAAVLSDEEHPEDFYHAVMIHFTEETEKTKRGVNKWEEDAQDYQIIKQYILSFIRQKDSRDIRVLDWKKENGEGWYLYRFYNEETERSIYVQSDDKVVETTDKNVTDLATAQKYSRRKIWTVLQEAPEH